MKIKQGKSLQKAQTIEYKYLGQDQAWHVGWKEAAMMVGWWGEEEER